MNPCVMLDHWLLVESNIENLVNLNDVIPPIVSVQLQLHLRSSLKYTANLAFQNTRVHHHHMQLIELI